MSAQQQLTQEVTMFTIKANRSTVHIEGIEERTRSLGEDNGSGIVPYYAESACGALTRSGHRMQMLGEYEGIERALNSAELATYSISGRKVCKTCKAAAEALLKAQTEAEEEAAAAASEAEALAAEGTPYQARMSDNYSLARITDLDSRIEVMQDRLAIAVDYATMFRTADDAESVEACEKAIRLANMLSQAILATAVRRTH
jgi:hypothetical protein